MSLEGQLVHAHGAVVVRLDAVVLTRPVLIEIEVVLCALAADAGAGICVWLGARGAGDLERIAVDQRRDEERLPSGMDFESVP